MCDCRQMPRVKSDSDTRKSKRSIQGGYDGAASPLLQRKGQVIDEEPAGPGKLTDRRSAFEAQEDRSSAEPQMSYLEKRRAERA